MNSFLYNIEYPLFGFCIFLNKLNNLIKNMEDHNNDQFQKDFPNALNDNVESTRIFSFDIFIPVIIFLVTILITKKTYNIFLLRLVLINLCLNVLGTLYLYFLCSLNSMIIRMDKIFLLLSFYSRSKETLNKFNLHVNGNSNTDSIFNFMFYITDNMLTSFCIILFLEKASTISTK